VHFRTEIKNEPVEDILEKEEDDDDDDDEANYDEDDEEEPSNDDDFDFPYGISSPAFVDPNIEDVTTTIKIEPNIKIESTDPTATMAMIEKTFDGIYTSDENEDNDDDDDTSFDHFADESVIGTRVRRKSKTYQQQKKEHVIHKMRSLVGKPACKYCDTIFKSKEEHQVHICRYLQCDPKHFICRICNKELSKKTFSNHVHETLDCQYCGKKFINPRNMKAHIQKLHKNDVYITPMPPDRQTYLRRKLLEDKLQAEATDGKKKKTITRAGKFECDLCGKYLVSLRSMRYHISLHTGETSYICETCG